MSTHRRGLKTWISCIWSISTLHCDEHVKFHILNYFIRCIQEADNWSVLSSEVEQLFEANDLNKVAMQI